MECAHLAPHLQNNAIAVASMSVASFFDTVADMLPWLAVAACIVIGTVLASTAV